MSHVLFESGFPELVQARLAAPLPGRDAQYRMASLRRREDNEQFYTQPTTDARVASVLNLLHYHEGQWRTVLIQRTSNPKDRHSGQVSFPGGRWEETDESLEQVALREAEEEVGIDPTRVRLLGRLTELYIPVSNYIVHPFVGMLEGEARFVPQPGEVAAVITPELRIFRHPDIRKVIDLPLGNGITLPRVPYFEVDGHVVWGATAMIMNEFLEAVFGEKRD
ncbi:MAG: CoA pyrophosphatase [Saprospiraceae bacterium]|nr:CoA pyrophosphatase [Saprospiraceae bacterium]